jgi:hypothetical protein
MGSLSPEQTIALLAAALVGVAVLAVLIRRSAGRRQPEATANVVFAAPSRASADVRPLRPQQTTGTSPNTPASLTASQAAPQPSYTAIAVAEAARAGLPASHETAPPRQTRIDYSDVPTDVLANASYTAIAIATAARHG